MINSSQRHPAARFSGLIRCVDHIHTFHGQINAGAGFAAVANRPDEIFNLPVIQVSLR